MKRPFALGYAGKRPADGMEKKKNPRVMKCGRILPAHLSGWDLRAQKGQWNQSHQRKGAANEGSVAGGLVCRQKEVAGKKIRRRSAQMVSDQIRTTGAQFNQRWAAQMIKVQMISC